jgi:hypothetical protein
VDQIDLTGPFEVLSRIPNSTDRIYGKTSEPVRDLKGLRLMPDAPLADAPQLDVLHVPGGFGQAVGRRHHQAARGDRSTRGRRSGHRLSRSCLLNVWRKARGIWHFRQSSPSYMAFKGTRSRPHRAKGASRPRDTPVSIHDYSGEKYDDANIHQNGTAAMAVGHVDGN